MLLNTCSSPLNMAFSKLARPNYILRRFSCDSAIRERVVITGMGVVSCLGLGVDTVWDSILAGKCGLSLLDQEEFHGVPCKVAGVVPRGKEAGQLDESTFFSKSESNRMSPSTRLALVAAEEALTQASWKPENELESERTGVVFGVGMADLAEIGRTSQLLSSSGYSKVSPFFIPRILNNMAAGHISMKYGFKGVNHCVSTACATGAHSIGDAWRFVANGDSDVVLCGGAESCIDRLSITGFSRMRALSTQSDPLRASRPFDAARDGFVMSEGAACFVLESLTHARRRDVTPLAELRGYGLSGDAHHVTTPPPGGAGALRCMQAALRNARMRSCDVQHVNAHATSTQQGDAAEISALCRLFNEPDTSVKPVYVSSTKGALGHLLGGAGAIEAVMAVQACRTGLLPPNLNLEQQDVLPVGGDEGRSGRVRLVGPPSGQTPSYWSSGSVEAPRVAITNSFGFGGTNATLVISEFREEYH